MADLNEWREIEATEIPWNGGHVISAWWIGFMAWVGAWVIATLLMVGWCENKKQDFPKISSTTQTIKN